MTLYKLASHTLDILLNTIRYRAGYQGMLSLLLPFKPEFHGLQLEDHLITPFFVLGCNIVHDNDHPSQMVYPAL